MEYDYSVDYTVDCTGAKGPAGGVGLWQFVVDNGDDVFTATKHTICRYGPDAVVAPDCPWNACLNGDCTKCRDF